MYNQFEVCEILLGKFSSLRSPGETWISCLLPHSRCPECVWQTPLSAFVDTIAKGRETESPGNEIWSPPPPHLFHKHKNALTGACSLACLEIRSRNEEAINSTRNMLYSLKVFYFLLYRRRYFLFVSELI